jgi:ketosteroid isomerase-like protein
MARRQFRLLSEGRIDQFMSAFDERSVFCFAGDHEFGGQRVGPDAIRPVIEAMKARFRDLRVTPVRIFVQGWPWNTVMACQLEVRASLTNGSPYRNSGMQLARLRWGKVVEDRIYEDTDVLKDALAMVSAA